MRFFKKIAKCRREGAKYLEKKYVSVVSEALCLKSS